jgi:hypothetical protein
MSKHYCIPLESSDEWKDALKDIKHSYYHTRENSYAMSLTTGYKTFLYLFENDGIKITCPLSERHYNGRTDIVTPYGFSGFAGNKNYPDFKNYWNEFVKEKKYVCGYISLNPLTENATYYEQEDSFKSTQLYFMNLKLSLTELFENLDTNRRKQIVNFKKAESEFIYDTEEIRRFLTENYIDFLKRINASKANYFTRETLEYICSLENVYMVGAGSHGKTEAVYIFAYTEFEGTCLFNVALPEGRIYSPLLLWSGLKFFRRRKIPVMNLGGGLKEDDNVAMSKERFGAYKLPLINLKQIYDPAVYHMLCSEKGKESVNRQGYFPAYR